MFIVTGTKRSGTSMWMQILIAAGLPIIGEAFPMRWEQTIKAANPEGFYESHLRRGIYYRTNPHPKTAAYLFPEQVQEGESFQVVAVLPEGHVEPLLWLHGYDPRYAHPFLLRTRLRLPAGTVIRGVPRDAVLVLLS